MIIESPDKIPAKSLNVESPGAYAFGYWKGKLLIADENIPHWKLGKTLGLGVTPRLFFKYPGRVWVNQRIISFWIYPTPEMFKKFIKDFNSNKKCPKKIDNNWKIEILPGISPDQYIEDSKVRKNETLIPITDYIGSNSRTKRDISSKHVESPMIKRSNVPQGVGSKKIYPDILPGETVAQYKNKKKMSEIMGEIDMNQNTAMLTLLENIIMNNRSKLLLENRSYLHGHTNEKNAYVIEDYPYGFHERTQKKMWIETHPKMGDRVVSMTLNPKNNRWNKPKKSTYYQIAVLYVADNGHIEVEGVSQYSGAAAVEAFVKEIGGIKKLNKDQLQKYKELTGQTTSEEPSWKHKFEKSYKDKKVIQLSITFDVADRITVGTLVRAIDEIIKKSKKMMQELYDNKGSVLVKGRRGVLISGAIGFQSFYNQVKNKLKNKLTTSVNESKSLNESNKQLTKYLREFHLLKNGIVSILNSLTDSTTASQIEEDLHNVYKKLQKLK